jgi:sterol desaturase/sphingolipid hydroxylase (fatty acid hydroxylase superfamily)
VIAIMFIPLERAFRAREQPIMRRAWFTDLAFFLGQYYVCAGAVNVILRAVARRVSGPLAPLHALAAEQPTWLRVAAVVLCGDLLIYWAHRLSHRNAFLWRFHRVHHTAEHLDWLAAYREHPIDGLYTQFWINLPALLIGLPPAALAGIATFRGLWAVFIHANVRVPIGPLRMLTGSPELHHWHHDRALGGTCNYANLMPIMDLVFGTYHRPDHEPRSYGIAEPVLQSYAAQLIAPFVPARLLRFQTKPRRDHKTPVV